MKDKRITAKPENKFPLHLSSTVYSAHGHVLLLFPLLLPHLVSIWKNVNVFNGIDNLHIVHTDKTLPEDVLRGIQSMFCLSRTLKIPFCPFFPSFCVLPLWPIILRQQPTFYMEFIKISYYNYVSIIPFTLNGLSLNRLTSLIKPESQWTYTVTQLVD